VRTLGSNLGAFIKGTDFNCNAAICYGIGAVHNRFMALQTTINRFAGSSGFAPLTVDGFIGQLTVDAAAAAATTVGLPVPGTTIQELATNADTFTTQLSAAGAGVFSPASTDTVDVPPVVDVSSATPPPEILASIQQASNACGVNALDPFCSQVHVLCTRVRGTPNADLPQVKQLCDTARADRLRKWIMIGLSTAIVVGSASFVVGYYRRRQRGAAVFGKRRTRA
jgi:hypothetical protein